MGGELIDVRTMLQGLSLLTDTECLSEILGLWANMKIKMRGSYKILTGSQDNRQLILKKMYIFSRIICAGLIKLWYFQGCDGVFRIEYVVK